VMGELAVDENKPRQQDGSAALTIYFAQPGENVWDIAKRYHTSMAAVMEENAIEKEQLRDRATLLIPLVV
ncbi:LysM domain-containing protein, partial [Ligaoa zhengdingensis]